MKFINPKRQERYLQMYKNLILNNDFIIEDFTKSRRPYKKKIVFIEWFHNNKRLGSGYVVEGSGTIDRQQEALKRGIKSYNRFVLDRGRLDIYGN